MRNSDMPAMPVRPEWIQGKPQVHEGLTKREYFMANTKLDGDAITFNDRQSLEDFIGRPVDMQSVEDIALAQCQSMAKLKRMQADADLAELEKTDA